MKFLTVCDGGNVRSHCMALLLKELGHEAIAVGRYAISPETMSYMCHWAEVIILMEPHMREHISPIFFDKLHDINVGPDYYGVGINPELRTHCEEGKYWLVSKLKNEGKYDR